MKRISSGSFVLQNFSVRIGLLCLNFGTGVIVARSLQPAGRGELTALMLWPILIAGLATLGIPAAINFRSRRDTTQAGSLLFAAELGAIVVGLIAAACGAYVIPFWLRGYDASVVHQAQWLMLFTPQCLLLYVLRGHLESRDEFVRSILGQLVPVIFTLFALLALRLAHELTPWTAALSYYVPPAVQTVWLAFRLRFRAVARIRGLARDLRELLSYGLRSYGTDVVNALSLQLDQAVILTFLSPAALGLYAVALSLTRVLNIVQQSIVMVLFPRASELPHDGALALVGRAVRVSNTVALVLGVAFVTLVPFVLPVLYGRAFAAALSIMPLLTAEAVLGGTAIVLGQAFMATGRPGVVTLVQAGWLVIVLTLLVLLVPRMNVSGAATALLLASIARIGLIALAYRLVLRTPLPRLLPDRHDISDLITTLLRATSLRPRLESALEES